MIWEIIRMNKAYLTILLTAAMMMTGCGGGDDNGSKDRTTTTTSSTAAESDEITSQGSQAETTPPQDSSEEQTETQTQPTEDSSQPDDDSSSQDDKDTKPNVEIKVEGSRITAADFGIDISYPDGWEVKSYEIDDQAPAANVAAVFNDDLGISSTVELVSLTEGIGKDRSVTLDEYIENLKQAYTELTTPDEGDPRGLSDATLDEGFAGKAKTVFLSYSQRGVKCYMYTFVFKNEKQDNSFLQFSYAFSDSDNTEHIKTALKDMMSK